MSETSYDLETTIRALEQALERFRADLKELTAAGRVLAQHLVEVRAETPRLIRLKAHSPPPLDANGAPVRRKRGRPPGAKNGILHVVASERAIEAIVAASETPLIARG